MPHAGQTNNDGQTDAPDGTYTAISAGGHSVCALNTSSNVKYWGSLAVSRAIPSSPAHLRLSHRRSTAGGTCSGCPVVSRGRPVDARGCYLHWDQSHEIITEGTLDDESEAGRLQQPGEERVEVVWDYGRVLHRPPSAYERPELPGRAVRFRQRRHRRRIPAPGCAGGARPFLARPRPPVRRRQRAHRTGTLPTGRCCARGYWLAKYTSISSIPRKAPAGHTRSYLYAEAETDSQRRHIFRCLSAAHGDRGYTHRNPDRPRVRVPARFDFPARR